MVRTKPISIFQLLSSPKHSLKRKEYLSKVDVVDGALGVFGLVATSGRSDRRNSDLMTQDRNFVIIVSGN